jgi:hypothetical protein
MCERRVGLDKDRGPFCNFRTVEGVWWYLGHAIQISRPRLNGSLSESVRFVVRHIFILWPRDLPHLHPSDRDQTRQFVPVEPVFQADHNHTSANLRPARFLPSPTPPHVARHSNPGQHSGAITGVCESRPMGPNPPIRSMLRVQHKNVNLWEKNWPSIAALNSPTTS